MRDEQVIAAISTPFGQGGIAVIRLSGRGSAQVVDRVFRGRSPLSSSPPWTMRHGHLVDPRGNPIDEVLAVHFKAPKSYTGEDSAEVHCHGGPLVAQMCLEALISAGARLAERGEFTRRAVINRRMDLSAASAVMALVSGQSPKAVEAAMGSLSGATRRAMEELMRDLTRACSHLEATLDMPEDEIPPLDRERLREDLSRIARGIRDLHQRGLAGMALSQGVQVTLVGRPNVGKSSLLNSLSRQARAIVTPIPGTTRDVVEAAVIHRGVPIKLLDTAGIRDSNDPIEALGVKLARETMLTADLRVLVLDGSSPPHREDLELLGSLDMPAAAALNKADLGTDPSWDQVLRDARVPNVTLSALSGQGLEELKDLMVRSICSNPAVDGAVTMFRHQLDALSRAAEALDGALSSPYLDATAQLALEAQRHLASALGLDPTEEVLEAVFRNFCVGK